MSTGAKISKTYPVINQVTVAQIRLISQDIENWRKAVDAARSTTMPRRRQLYELYENIVLDGHLSAVMEKRRIAITNKKLLFVEEDKEGEPNEGIQQNILDTPWMTSLLGHAIDQVAWGHSLIELIPVNGIIGAAELVPRGNVRPEESFLMWNYANDQEGFNYKTEPYYSRYLLEVGGRKDYGKLMTAAQYAIYKRGGFGDWAQFAELFGMPLRIGKYNPFDATSRNLLVQSLEQAGSAAYVVIPDGTSMEFKDANQSGKSEVYRDLLAMCNEEMSKIFLGNTLTTAQGEKGARSLGEVHKDVEEEINISDMLRIEYLLNWDFKQKMIALGASELAKGKIKFEQTTEIPLEKRIEIDVKVAQQVAIDPAYWYETYGVPMPDSNSIPPKIETEDPDGDPEPPTPPRKKKDPVKVKAQHDGCCELPEINASISSDQQKAFDKLLKAVWNGGEYSFEYWQTLVDAYISAFDRGWMKSEPGSITASAGLNRTLNIEYDDPDFEMLNFLEMNVFQFAAAETLEQAQLMNSLLAKSKTFGDFKRNVLDAGIQVNSLRDLRTNYNLAYNTAYTSADYYRMVKDKDIYPSWQYKTVGDSRVRNAHRALDGKIFKADDPVWDTIYPPNGWNCRCYVKPLAYKPQKYATKEEAIADLGEVLDNNNQSELDRMKKDGFDKNRAKTGTIFELSKKYVKHLDGNLGVKKMYGSDNYTWDKIKESDLPERPINITNNADAKQWFDDKKKDGVVSFKDYLNRTIELTEDTFKSHVNDKAKYKLRHQILDLIPEILNNPDEVWLHSKSQNTFNYIYAKFYENEFVLVITEVENGVPIKVKTFFEAAEDAGAFRSGILVKRYK